MIVPHGELFAALPDPVRGDALCNLVRSDRWTSLLGAPASVSVVPIGSGPIQQPACKIEAKNRWTVHLLADKDTGSGDPVNVHGQSGTLDTDDSKHMTTVQAPISERLTTATDRPTNPDLAPYLTVQVQPWSTAVGDPKALAQKIGGEALTTIGAAPQLPQPSDDGSIPAQQATVDPGHATTEYPTPVMAQQMCTALSDVMKVKISKTKAKFDGECSADDDGVDLTYQSAQDVRNPNAMPQTVAGHKARIGYDGNVILQTTAADDQFIRISSTRILVMRYTHSRYKSVKALTAALIPKLLPK